MSFFGDVWGGIKDVFGGAADVVGGAADWVGTQNIDWGAVAGAGANILGDLIRGDDHDDRQRSGGLAGLTAPPSRAMPRVHPRKGYALPAGYDTWPKAQRQAYKRQVRAQRWAGVQATKRGRGDPTIKGKRRKRGRGGDVPNITLPPSLQPLQLTGGGGTTVPRRFMPTTSLPPYVNPAAYFDLPDDPLGGALPGLVGGAADWLFGNGNGKCGGLAIVDSIDDLYYETSCGGTRPRRTFATINPESGSLSYWRNQGQPVLWSGDASTCKRVRRVAGKAYRSSGGRSRSYSKKR